MIDNPGGLLVTFILSYKLLLYSRNPQRYRAMPVDGGITIFVAALVPFLVKFVERPTFQRAMRLFLVGNRTAITAVIHGSTISRPPHTHTTLHTLEPFTKSELFLERLDEFGWG